MNFEALITALQTRLGQLVEEREARVAELAQIDADIAATKARLTHNRQLARGLQDARDAAARAAPVAPEKSKAK